MILASDIILRTRDYLNQQAIGAETLTTRAQARPQRGIDSQIFSDEHILELIHQCEVELMGKCDACFFPNNIEDYNGGFNPIDPDIVRILENTIFRDNIRCIILDPDNTGVRRKSKTATNTKPVAVIGSAIVTVYPASPNVSCKILAAPAKYTTAEVAAGTDVLAIADCLSEAMTHWVAGQCRMSQAIDGEDAELMVTLYAQHKRLHNEELLPFLRVTRLSRKKVDAENSVEKETR